jgi:hypothetical protein
LDQSHKLKHYLQDNSRQPNHSKSHFTSMMAAIHQRQHISGGNGMKPAIAAQATSKRLLVAFTRGACIVALSIGAMLTTANATGLPTGMIQNVQNKATHSSTGAFKRRSSRTVTGIDSASLNAILKSVKTPGTILEQGALSWPPQFAIGQTWSVTFNGVGTWTLPLSRTVAGDATGDTTGTDKREGWFKFFPKTATTGEFVALYLAGDNETYACGILSQGNPTGNTLNGGAIRLKANNQPEDLKTSCSATLGASSSATTTSPFGTNNNVPLNPNTSAQSSSLNWPPKPGEAWSLTIDGLTPWAINFEKLDQDGDPTGTATQGSSVFTAFAFNDTGIAGVFQMANRQTSESYYCTFKTLSIQGNSFTGGSALYQPKGGQASSLNKSCTATLGSAANNNGNNNQAQTLSWPPQLAVGQKWDYRLGSRPVVYHGNFSSVENQTYKGDLITDGTGDPIAKRTLSVVFSTKDDALIAFAEDPQGGITGCLFNGKASLQNNAYVGPTLFRAAGAKDFVDQNAPCRMSAVTTPVSTNNPNGNAQNSALTPVWPPKPGESWTVTIDGLAPWAINFDKLDKTGDPAGSAVQSGASFDAAAYKDADGYEFEIADRNNVYFCTFTSLQVQGNAFVGGKAYGGPVTAQSVPSLNKSCSASIGASTSANNGVSPFANNQPPVASNLNWPPSIAIGQSWAFSVQGGGSWTISLEKASSITGAFSGSVKGSDVRNNGLIGYDAQGDYTVAAVYGTNDTWLCLAAKRGFTSSSITGESYRAIGNANPAKTGTSCTIAPAGAAAASGGTGTLGGLFGNTTGNTTPATSNNAGLSWPVQVAIGQTWAVNVNKTAFQLKLERINNGFTIGTATSSSGELAGGFVTQGDNLNLILTDGTATITCTFNRSSLQGTSLNGQATYSEKPNAPEKNFGACNATLAARAGSIAGPLDFVPRDLFGASRTETILKSYSSLN